MFKFLRISPFVIVSGSPPLLLIITAQPAEEASKLVLPKGTNYCDTCFFVNFNNFIMGNKAIIF